MSLCILAVLTKAEPYIIGVYLHNLSEVSLNRISVTVYY